MVDTYRDDISSGADNEEDAVELSQTLIHLPQAGGFLLRKLPYSIRAVLREIPWDQQEIQPDLDVREEIDLKTLGVRCNPVIDAFKFRVNITSSVWHRQKERYSQKQPGYLIYWVFWQRWSLT